MATAYDVNIKIGSQIGCTIPANSRLVGYVPDIKTTLTLDNEIIPYSGVYTVNNAPLLSISASPTLDNVAPADFILSPFSTSTFQKLYLTNKGNAVLTITEVLGTASPSIVPVMSIFDALPPYTIQPGEQLAVSGAYYAYEPGIYDNYFIFQSNSVNGWAKIATHQIVLDTQNFLPTPDGFNTTINTVGKVQTQTYQLIPIFNNIESPGVAMPSVEGTLAGNPGWSIVSTGTNSITVQFDAAEIGNVSGTYTSVLTIIANGASHEVTNTATVHIDYAINKNLATWLSPVSHDNSVIGISYDLENDQQIMTIGVGTSSGALVVTAGDPHIYTSDLGLGKQYSGYGNWSKVYRIPFVGDARTYYSKDYAYKTTTASDYSSYFGEFGSAESMFVVTDDGYGSALVELNNLTIFNTATVTTSTGYTLHNLTRAFHYYSDIDVGGGRITVRYHSDWFNAISTANTKFLFIQNNNDTLAKNSMVLPFVNSLPPAKTNLELVTEGTVTPGVYDHNYTTSLSDHIKDYAVKAFPTTPEVTPGLVQRFYDISYGTNRLQKVDVLAPVGVTPRGVVMHIHGGGWSGGSKSAYGFSPSDAAYTNNDEAELELVANAGYYVINCNYRLTSLEAYGYGGDGTGGYPNAIEDIKTILRYCLVSGAGTSVDSRWDSIYAGVSIYGLLVTGSSSGGHLAVMGVCDFGTETGLWPLAVGSTAGPMDLVYSPNGKNDNPMDTPVQNLVNSFTNPDGAGGTLGYNDANAKASSPRYKYGNFIYSDQFIPSFPEYTSPLANDPTTTQLFTGFNYNTRDRTATTATSIVSIPS